ncbi:DUF2812 domain-containing protein [Eubacteriaceae bacterium ES2]|nr:DUF2812 domain-containing protein [Eubacteriaceae bacterium ES2]
MGEMKKTSYRVYAAWNYDKEENDLDELSQKGWQLEKGGCFHSKFVKDESVTYRHRIDFNPVILKSSEEKERYVESFEEQGWEYVNNTFNGWAYFRKIVVENSLASEYEIYSDQQSYYGMLSRWIRVGWVCITVELLAALLYVIQFFENGDPFYIVGAAIFMTISVWIFNGIGKMKAKINERAMN